MAQLFRENGIEYEKVHYFSQRLTQEKLRDLLRKAGLKPYDLLRKGEAVVKELGLSADTPPDELIKLIVENPNLLQRPIVEVGDKAVLARPIELALDLLDTQGKI